MVFIGLQDQKANLLKIKYKKKNLGNVMKNKLKKRLKKLIKDSVIELIALIEYRLRSNAKQISLIKRITSNRGFRKKKYMFINRKVNSLRQ